MSLMRIMILAVCLNLFIYIGTSFYEHTSGTVQDSRWKVRDMFDLLLQSGQSEAAEEGINQYITDLEMGNISRSSSLLINENITTSPSLKTASEEGIFQMSDPIKMILGFPSALFGTFINIAVLPIRFIFGGLMPITIGLIIGLPLLAINMAAILSFIRGT